MTRQDERRLLAARFMQAGDESCDSRTHARGYRSIHQGRTNFRILLSARKVRASDSIRQQDAHAFFLKLSAESALRRAPAAKGDNAHNELVIGGAFERHVVVRAA